MLHFIMVLNRQGSVLLSRYLDRSSEGRDLVVFERKLLRALIFIEPNVQRQFCNVHGFCVCIQKLTGELQLLIGGSEETDEMICAVLMDTVQDIFKDQLGGKLTEKAILETENYGKLMLALDEFACDGIVESTSAEAIGKSAKLKVIS